MQGLKETRITKKLSQRTVARLLGLSRATINRIEQGHHTPKPETRKMIQAWITRSNAPTDSHIF